MGRRLIVLGASSRAAAHSAARAGYKPYAIDLFADRDLAALCPVVRIERYPSGFLRALAAAPSAPWIYTGGLENYPRLVARMAELRPLWGNSAHTLRAVRDPWRVYHVLRDEGLACPDLWSAGSQAGGKWLFKPQRGSAGLGVRFATDEEFGRDPKGVVLQEFIEGESCSATFVAASGRAVLLGATRQIVGRDWGLTPEFLYVGSLGPLPLTALESAKLTRLGDVLAQRFGLVGLVGVDVVRTADDIWPVEVNPRYTASVEVLERFSGRCLVGYHAAACTRGELPSSSPAPSGPCAGKAIVYARRAGVWGRESWAGISFSIAEDSCPPKTPDPFDVEWPNIADLPHEGQRFETGQPMATVFATGHDLATVQQRLSFRERALLDALFQYPCNS